MLYSDILDDVLENKSDMQKSLCECRGIFVFAALDFTKELLGMCRGRCPHRPADLPEGSNFLVQPCRNRPAEFARFSRCPPGACQRRLLPLPVSVMLIFKCFLVQMGDFISYGVCKFICLSSFMYNRFHKELRFFFSLLKRKKEAKKEKNSPTLVLYGNASHEDYTENLPSM